MTGQQVVITSPESTGFAFGIDSVFYTTGWHRAISAPIRKEHTTFFVILRDDSSLLYKRVPKSPDIHHYVIEKSNTGKTTIFYRGILGQVPDTVKVLREKTGVLLSTVIRSKIPPTKDSIYDPILLTQTSRSAPDMVSDTARKNEYNNLVLMPYKTDTIDQTTEDLSKSPEVNLDGIIKKVNEEMFEFEKMILLKDYVEEHQPDTKDLMVLAKLLTYDLTRLQLLKESYPFIRDPNNYRDLINVFDFEVSRQSFLQFLSERER